MKALVLAAGLGIAFRNRPADVLPVGATTPKLVQVLSADNGLTWTHHTSAFSGGTGVVYASTQEKFVMCGTDRSHSIWTAADGFTWAEQGVAGFEGFGICYTHGLVVSVGNSSPGWGYTSVSSSDLAAWAVNPLPSALTFASSVCPCAGGVIAGSDNGNNYVSVSLI